MDIDPLRSAFRMRAMLRAYTASNLISEKHNASQRITLVCAWVEHG